MLTFLENAQRIRFPSIGQINQRYDRNFINFSRIVANDDFAKAKSAYRLPWSLVHFEKKIAPGFLSNRGSAIKKIMTDLVAFFNPPTIPYLILFRKLFSTPLQIIRCLFPLRVFFSFSNFSEYLSLTLFFSGEFGRSNNF